MPPSKRKHEPSNDHIAVLAAAVRRSRQLHRQQHKLDDAAETDLTDAILKSLEDGTALPSTKLAKGADFEEVEDEACFGEAVGVEFIDQMRTDKLTATKRGKAALKAIAACSEADEDEAHWEGPHAELLEAIVSDACPPRIHVMRALNPFNPVALLTPLSEAALCAVAAENISESEPIAVYLGDLRLAEEESAATAGDAGNMYLYELDEAEMRARGYKGPGGLRVDASKAGGEARFINDKWSPDGLPVRVPNCYIELIFDAQDGQFLLVFFASRRIKKGAEIIADCARASSAKHDPAPCLPSAPWSHTSPYCSVCTSNAQTGRTTGESRARSCFERTRRRRARP